MPKDGIQNSGRLKQRLQKLANKYGPTKAEVHVGYFGVNYAIFVHEIQATHIPPTQCKFLERHARENQKKYAATMAGALKLGSSAMEAVTVAALLLQRDSQKLVPIDTSNLRGSAGIKPVTG